MTIPHPTIESASAEEAPRPGDRRRPLVLHIGLHKTATSYVQRMLWENRDLLRARGVGLGVFPISRGDAHHAVLAAVARDGAAATLERLAAAPGERLLLSSEIFCRWFEDPARAAAFAAAAERHFRPRLILVLRRQDHLKESLFAEEAKDFYCGDIAGYDHYPLDHDARLRGLEAAFGRENIAVLLYPEGGGPDLFAQVLAAAGIAIDPAALRPVERQNVSVHRRKRLFFARLPKEGGESDPAVYRLLRVIARTVEHSARIADDGVRTLLAPGVRHALVAAQAAGNAAVAARYGLAETGQFLALPDPSEPWQPPRPLTAGEIAAVSAQILRACLRVRPAGEGLRLAAAAGRRLTAAAAGPAPRPVPRTRGLEMDLQVARLIEKEIGELPADPASVRARTDDHPPDLTEENAPS